jgi:hypothetical protein
MLLKPAFFTLQANHRCGRPRWSASPGRRATAILWGVHKSLKLVLLSQLGSFWNFAVMPCHQTAGLRWRCKGLDASNDDIEAWLAEFIAFSSDGFVMPIKWSRADKK